MFYPPGKVTVRFETSADGGALRVCVLKIPGNIEYIVQEYKRDLQMPIEGSLLMARHSEQEWKLINLEARDILKNLFQHF
jgi:hypothetical protein